MEELTEAFEKIKRGDDPNDEEIDTTSANGEDPGSDSCPSDDNIDLRQLYDIMYCQRNKSMKTLLEKKDTEEKFEKDFAKFKKKVQKKVRDASKDSGFRNMSSLHLSTSSQIHKDGQSFEKQIIKSRQLTLENNKQYANMARLDANRHGQ